MKKKSKVYVVILICVLLAGIAATGFGWFYNSLTEKMSVTSYVRKSYFESGSGTVDDPFEIKYPVQLYYFTWLQNMGYFNQNLDEQRRVRPMHFYVSRDLDMSGFTLPPAGSQQFPFLGEFDGRNHVISNLTVCNQSESDKLTDIPSTDTAADGQAPIHEKTDPQIVGFFGVVGEYNEIYSANKQIVCVHDFNLNNVTVRSEQPKDSKTLVGIAAGYINGTVENVGVADCTVSAGQNIQALDADKLTANISDYTLAGYCKPEYVDQLAIERISADKPKLMIATKDSASQGNAWGGSIDMKTMFSRLSNIRQNSTTVSYPLDETRTTELDGTTHKTANQSMTLFETSHSNAAFTFKENSGNYIYLYGKEPYELNVSHITKTLEPTAAVYISDGNSDYLNISSNHSSVEAGTSEQNATRWIFDDSGQIYTTGPDEIKYYLHGAGGLSIRRDSSDTVWTHDTSNGILSYQYNGEKYILKFNSNTWQVSAVNDQTVRKFYIHSENNYLSLNSTRDGVVNVTDEASATKWTFSDPDAHKGTISCTIDGITYFLKDNGSSNGNIQIVQSEGTEWRIRDGNKLFFRSGLSRYFIQLNNGNWRYQKKTGTELTFSEFFEEESRTTLTSTTLDVVVANTRSYKETTERGRDTYFPLSVSDTDSSVTADSNTGYIISGANVAKDITPNGDIRVSKYGMENISASTNSSGNYVSSMEILTRTADSNGYCRIEDEYNSGNSNVSSEMNNHTSSKELYNGAKLNLTKYKDSRDKLEAVFNGDPSNIYGLHFMDASISLNHTIRVPSVTLNGETFTNYQLPQDCIDFHLKERGRINFFAGTYFKLNGVNNSSFFSLHKIERGADNDITSIREIKKVYGKSDDPRADYIYDYGGGEYSDPLYASDSALTGAGYKMLFDLAWIPDPNANGGLLQNAVYYFEIPVNDGEYALGSVPGSNGAYLFYLDISANSQLVQEQELTERTEKNRGEYVYPLGIQLLEHSALHGTDPLDPTDSVSAAQPSSGFNTKISRAGNEATMTETGQTVNFVGADLTLNDESGNPLVAEAVTSRIVREKKVTVVEYNSTEDTTTTTVTRTTDTTTIDAQGTETREVTIQINDDPPTMGTAGDHLVPIADPFLRYHFMAPATVTATYTFVPQYTVADYPEIGIDLNVSNSITEYRITAASTAEVTLVIDENKFPYLVTINGATIKKSPVDPLQKITVSAI